MPRFAVDSAIAANAEVSPDLTAFADAKAWAGAAPALWGRYLGTGGGAATPLTAAEANWLFAQGCGVLPIYNDSTINGGTPGTYALGQQDAARAIAQARAIGVPAGIYLVADVEYGAAVTGDWLRGWADAMRASEYGGAGILYCAPRSPNFAQAWQDALSSGNANISRLLIWSATPEPGPSTAAAMPPWGPDVPTGGTVVLWQYAEGAYGGPFDLDEADDAWLAGPGIWMPAAPAPPVEAPGSPPPSTLDTAALSAALAQAEAGIAAARKAAGLTTAS